VNKGLHGTQARFGRLGKEKNLLPLPGFRPRTAERVAQSLNKLRHPPLQLRHTLPFKLVFLKLSCTVDPFQRLTNFV